MSVLESKFELALKNPRKNWSDSIPIWVKVFWKKHIASSLGGIPHHHIIIPATKNHTSWILGAQPDRAIIKKVYNETYKKKVHIVSMLAAGERILTETASIFNKENGFASRVDRMPWFDHGTLNLTTGKNQTVASMRKFQESFYEELEESPSKTQFYCHCMAGISRSLLETMAFIYFYPNKERLFDFENWPQTMVDKIPDYLRGCLKDNPSFYEIAEFIKIQRPNVKAFTKIDGDQAGLAGLMALSKIAENTEAIKKKKINNEERLYTDACDIGLVLKAPLDKGFRDEGDLKAQEENFAAVYSSYKESGIDLLKAMIIPAGLKQIVNPEENFAENFRNLSPSEQARFAILGRKLKGGECNNYGLEYARTAVKQAEKLTAGDQVELLRVFGSKALSFEEDGEVYSLTTEDVMKKILTGRGVDRHNAGIQLVELFHITENNK